jgi:hypothetical protein
MSRRIKTLKALNFASAHKPPTRTDEQCEADQARLPR